MRVRWAMTLTLVLWALPYGAGGRGPCGAPYGTPRLTPCPMGPCPMGAGGGGPRGALRGRQPPVLCRRHRGRTMRGGERERMAWRVAQRRRETRIPSKDGPLYRVLYRTRTRPVSRTVTRTRPVTRTVTKIVTRTRPRAFSATGNAHALCRTAATLRLPAPHVQGVAGRAMPWSRVLSQDARVKHAAPIEAVAAEPDEGEVLD
jgi:hypothetical protein